MVHRYAFEEAVISHMMSDVAYGVLLSGGLDSSLCASVMSRYVSKPFHSAFYILGLISPGVSVPVAVPGGSGGLNSHDHVPSPMGASMVSPMASPNYWPRLQ